MKDIAWLLPALPLLGFIINGLGRKALPKMVAGIIGSAAVVGSFIIGLMLFMHVHETQHGEVLNYYRWLSVGSLVIDLGLYIDQLSAWMILIITGIGFLIHVYSTGYMHDDEGHNKFFSYLNLLHPPNNLYICYYVSFYREVHPFCFGLQYVDLFVGKYYSQINIGLTYILCSLCVKS
jgi:formate hydrogenlyase subunit 3/multisubunit Na+/H+ antiporter MnhD subunit